MARENVRFQEGNFTSDGIYFYSMLDGSQALQQKVDDGTVAFTFPLDTAVAGNIKELEWDGVYFWSLEDRPGGDGVTIRKWAIESFICKQQQVFQFIDGATHTYNSDAFALEHYRLTVGVNSNGDDYTFGLADVNISDTSMLEPGDVLTFVRQYTSTAQRVGTVFVEQATVQSVLSATQVRLTAAMSGTPHGATGDPGDGRGFRGPTTTPGASEPDTPDLVYVTKNIWMANDDSPNDPGTPSVYKIRAANGSNLIQFSGTQYEDINGLAFYTKYEYAPISDNYAGQPPYREAVVVDSSEGGRQTYLLVARDSTLLFFNTDTNIVDRSLVMNNIRVDTVNHWEVHDMHVGGIEPDIILYRLQQGTTYRNQALNLVDESWAQYNYEKQLLRRVVNSIAVSVDPSILPADGNCVAEVSATLRDQYNDTVPSGRTVNFTDDAAADGGVTAAQASTDEFGVARVQYAAGVNEKDVKITASVDNGLLP